MMSSSGATYAPTLSPLSMGHMLISARSIVRFLRKVQGSGGHRRADSGYNQGMRPTSPLTSRTMVKWLALAVTGWAGLVITPPRDASAAPATQGAAAPDVF